MPRTVQQLAPLSPWLPSQPTEGVGPRPGPSSGPPPLGRGEGRRDTHSLPHPPNKTFP